METVNADLQGILNEDGTSLDILQIVEKDLKMALESDYASLFA